MLGLRNLRGNAPELEMLMLTEEVGELAKAIRKDYSSLKADNSKVSNYDKVSSEIVDIRIHRIIFVWRKEYVRRFFNYRFDYTRNVRRRLEWSFENML